MNRVGRIEILSILSILINLIMTTRVKTALNLEESCVLLTAFGNLGYRDR
jgi:Na+-transporting NADH:ubiquinone oxidoreductase subunit NqrD